MTNMIMSPIKGQDLTVFAYEAITVGSTAVGFTAGTYSPATYGPAHKAFITIETDQIRWTCDGTTPTSTTGHLAAVGDVIEIEGIANVAAFKAIRTATDASIKVSYSRFRRGS